VSRRILNQIFEAGAGVDTARDSVTSGHAPGHGLEFLGRRLGELPVGDISKVDASGQRRSLDDSTGERSGNGKISDRTQSHKVDHRSAQFENARGRARDIEGHNRCAPQGGFFA
jgi:hypothetical protein